MKHHKPALGFILVTVLLDTLGFGILIPVAPRLVQELLGPGTTDGEAAKWVGYLASTFAVMVFLVSPTLGALSDRFGRRNVLLLSMLGSGLDYFAMAFAPSLSWFFVTRVLNGLTGASITVANAYVADVTPPEKRAGAFGLLYAAFGMGFVLGPLLGGVLGNNDAHIRWPFYAAGTLALTNWLYGFFVLPESLAAHHRSHLKLSRLNPVGVFTHIAKYPLVIGLASALFFTSMAQFALHVTWVLYTKHRYDFTPMQVGFSLFIVGMGAAMVQGGLAKKIIHALGKSVLGERRALLIGAAIGVLAFIGYGLATEGWMIYAIVAVASFGGIAQPAAQALITRSVLPTEQGATQGAITALNSIASVLGYLLGPIAFSYGIAKTTQPPFNHPGLSYFMSAALAFVGGVVAYFATHRLAVAAKKAASETTPAGT